MKKVYLLLHYLSMINTYILLVCIIYFLQRYTIGFFIRLFTQNYICEIIYILISIVFVNKTVNISSPYQKYLQ